MRTFLFYLLILVHLQGLQAQTLPENLRKVEHSSELKEGFYLYSTRNKNLPSGAEIIKRLGEGNFIIHLPAYKKIKFPEEDHLYEVSPEWKLSPALLDYDSPGVVLLSVKAIHAKFPTIANYEVLQQDGNFLVIRATTEDLQRLLQDPNIVHIAKFTPPKVETSISYNDLSANQINYLHHKYPLARGKNMRVSVKENLFNPDDVDIWNRTFSTELQGDKIDQHASIIATLIIGAGNSGSNGKGVAPGAEVGSSSFLKILPDPAENFITSNISVQNHSYGTAIEYEYGNEAAAYDAMVEELPWLVHIFSSGNLGTETPTFGEYAGLQGFANMTGNFKYAKNIITVGALDSSGKILPQSSKGPAPDGRIKPELVAYAPAGTSDAAALVSGTVLLLQEEFFNQNQVLPNSALIKSVLFAGAEDVGPENIDFLSGYGNLNASKSMEILNSGSFYEGTVTESGLSEFKIQVPKRTAELKVALSWIDPSANPGDNTVLLNDLDLQVIAPDGSSWNPWVLNTSSGSFLETAKRGRDSLNPVELITVEQPISGNYTIVVTASKISGDNQAFSIAYDTEEEDDFTWTYPTSSDALFDNEENLLRWQNTFPAQTAILEIKSGNSDWQLLGSPDLQSESYQLNLKEASGSAQLRMTIDSQVFLSDKFVIAPEILPKVAFNCEDEFMLVWDKVEGASSYQIQYLGEHYMEPAVIVQDTTALIQKIQYKSNIWSVQPLFEDIPGHSGRAIDYRQQGVDCHYRNFFAYLEQGPQVKTILNLSSGLFISEVQILRENAGEISVLKSFTEFSRQLQLEIDDPGPNAGKNLYYAVIKLLNGTEIRTEAVEIYVPGELTFDVYPNPIRAGEVLSIRSRGDELGFEIYDFQGKQLSQDFLVRYTEHVEININSRGMYFIRALRGGKEVGVAKILVY